MNSGFECGMKLGLVCGRGQIMREGRTPRGRRCVCRGKHHLNSHDRCGFFRCCGSRAAPTRCGRMCNASVPRRLIDSLGGNSYMCISLGGSNGVSSGSVSHRFNFASSPRCVTNLGVKFD